eukprot:11399466-Alexandrium_andersonii.AAC.1
MATRRWRLRGRLRGRGRTALESPPQAELMRTDDPKHADSPKGVIASGPVGEPPGSPTQAKLHDVRGELDVR